MIGCILVRKDYLEGRLYFCFEYDQQGTQFSVPVDKWKMREFIEGQRYELTLTVDMLKHIGQYWTPYNAPAHVIAHS